MLRRGLLRVRFGGPMVGEGNPTKLKLLFLCDVCASAASTFPLTLNCNNTVIVRS